MKPTDVRIESVQHRYEDYLYRTPIKFGGTALDRVTLVNVECTVRTASGKTARGFGSMPLGNVWSFPSRILGYDATLAAMKTLVERIGRSVGGFTESGHPIDLAVVLEPEHHKAAADVTRDCGWRSRSRRCVRWSPPAPSTPPSMTPTARFTASIAIKPTAPIFCPTTLATTSDPSLPENGSISTSRARPSRGCRSTT